MSFLKKIFKTSNKKPSREELDKLESLLPLDELFVRKFTSKGGKFLYCTHTEEVVKNLLLIFAEHSYSNILCYDNDLCNLLTPFAVKVHNIPNDNIPFFTNCESLIGKEGDILFTSHQIKERKLVNYSDRFIVLARTSQIVKNNGDAMRGINFKYKNNLPSNISSIRYFNLKEQKENFMNYGKTNSKDMYLILLEDL